jgi:hypothetical protein
MADTLKFYFDTHISKQVALQLRQKGVDVMRCEEVGMATADDETHLEYAAQQNYVLITVDKGFRDRAFEWLANGKEHAGVIIVHPDLKGKAGVGQVVEGCLFFHEAVKEGAATLDDFKNNVHYIP